MFNNVENVDDEDDGGGGGYKTITLLAIVLIHRFCYDDAGDDDENATAFL